MGLQAVVGILKGCPPSQPSNWENNKQFEPLLTELWEIIVDCLSKDPGQRPTSDQLVERCEALGYCNTARIMGIIREYPVFGRRYGWITTIDSNKTVFFHRDSFFGSEDPKSNMRVAFATFPGSPYERAYPVLSIISS